MQVSLKLRSFESLDVHKPRSGFISICVCVCVLRVSEVESGPVYLSLRLCVCGGNGRKSRLSLTCVCAGVMALGSAQDGGVGRGYIARYNAERDANNRNAAEWAATAERREGLWVTGLVWEHIPCCGTCSEH